MDREDAKDLTLSILVIVAAVLAADCIWLHMRCSRQEETLQTLAVQVDRLLNPPPVQAEPSFSDKAKQTFNKVKSAAVKGYEAAKDELRR